MRYGAGQYHCSSIGLVQLRVNQSLDLIETDDIENLADTVTVLVEDSRTKLSKPFVLSQVNGVPYMSNTVLGPVSRNRRAGNALFAVEERDNETSDFRQIKRVLGLFD